LGLPEKRQKSIEFCRFSIMIAFRQDISYKILRIVMIGIAKLLVDYAIISYRLRTQTHNAHRAYNCKLT